MFTENTQLWMFTEDTQLWMFTRDTQLWMFTQAMQLWIFNCGCLLRTPCFTKYSAMGVLLLIPDCECLITNPEWQTPSCGSLMTSTQLVVKWQTPNCRCLWQMTVSQQMLDWLLGDRCLTVHDRWLAVWWQIAWLAAWWQIVWWQMLDWLLDDKLFDDKCLTGLCRCSTRRS